ncbi:MAG TPA: hypothetical protein VM491_14190 [Burkholderiaceae bacterium]|nr:hypothetical protein [Burkholderiaceae bacterium]
MTAVYFDRKIGDDQRRELLYRGDLFVYSPNEHTMELVELARKLLTDGFDGTDPRTAQYRYDVRTYAQVLAKVKPAFIHHPECKRILPRILASIGCDLEQVHFDIPRMRSATSDGYLTAGIAYAFHPHRDTWYSAPMCQINWWLPIYEIDATNTMAFHPVHFTQPVRNDSETYNYQEWNATSRFNAAQFIEKDTRKQPHALEPVQLEPKIVIVQPPGGLMLFSAAHLHSTLPNHSGETRFSIDFRTVHVGDLRAKRGARNVDSKCTGSAIDDYLRGTDLAHIPEDVQAMYLPGHPQPAEIE